MLLRFEFEQVEGLAFERGPAASLRLRPFPAHLFPLRRGPEIQGKRSQTRSLSRCSRPPECLSWSDLSGPAPSGRPQTFSRSGYRGSTALCSGTLTGLSGVRPTSDGPDRFVRSLGALPGFVEDRFCRQVFVSPPFPDKLSCRLHRVLRKPG